MKQQIQVTLRYSVEVRDRLAQEPRGTRTALIAQLLRNAITAKRHLTARQLPRGRGEVCQTTVLLDSELFRPLQGVSQRQVLSPLVEILLREHYGLPPLVKQAKTSNENNEIQTQTEGEMQ